MRLAVDASALGSGRGGDETYMRALVRGLHVTAGQAGDCEVTLYTRRGADLQDEHPGLRWKQLDVSGAARLAGPLGLQWRRDRHDVHLAYTHTSLGAPARTALVVTDLSFRHLPDAYPRTARARLNTMVPLQARRAPAVVTLTDFCRQDLINTLGLDPAKVHVVPCAIDPVETLAADAERATANSLAQRGVTGPYVLYLGNLHPRKNVPHLIRCFAESAACKARQAKLVIAGASWWNGNDEAGPMAECRPDSIVSLGRVTDLERDVLLRRATVLAYPSLYEGFGLPPLEAMARGTAVIASNRTSIPEVLGDAALLVDPTDAAALSSAIDQLFESDDVRAEFERKGSLRCDLYSPAATGRALAAALATV